MCIDNIGGFVLVIVCAILAVALVRMYNKPAPNHRADRDSYMMTSLRPATVVTPVLESDEEV